jgi:hypothetical protein
VFREVVGQSKAALKTPFSHVTTTTYLLNNKKRKKEAALAA